LSPSVRERLPGKAAAFLRAVKPGNGAALTQVIAPGELAGKRVRYSGQVKTAAAEPGVGLWMRVDSPKGSPSFDNMSGRLVKGDQDWGPAEIVLDVPADATAIAFGVILFGKGTLWLDDLKLEVVDQSVPVTSPLEKKLTGEGRESVAGLPEKPVNLGFEDGFQKETVLKVQALTRNPRSRAGPPSPCTRRV
jgi:hypothetical protein